MKIYTRTGDKGLTSLFGGKRVSKNDLRIKAYGTVDELNSLLGIVLTEKLHTRTQEILSHIQQILFVVGGELATPNDVKSSASQNLSIEEIELLEKWIDELDVQLSPLKNFILPGGSKAAAQLHFTRTVCRRAERNIIEIEESENISEKIVIYVNRLSDLLFIIARFENHISSTPEIEWNTRG